MKKRIYLYISALLITLVLTNPSKDDVLTQLNKGTYTADSAKSANTQNQYHWHDVYDVSEHINLLFFSIYNINGYMEGISADSIHYPRIRKSLSQERYLGIFWKVIKLH